MPTSFSELDLVRSVCQSSFFEFLREFWDVVVPEEPVWNWHIKYLCDELQKMAERVFAGKPKAYDLVVNIPPGTTKSTIVSVAFAPWTWTRMPSARHIVSTHAQDLGLEFSRKSRKLIQETVRNANKPTYQECWPNIELEDDQNTKGLFVNTKGGSRLAATVGGKSPIGFHGHFLTVDDPIDPQAALSEADLKAANSFMGETLSARKVDKRVTPTILVMQRLHQNDPSGYQLMKMGTGIKHICLPADHAEGYPVHPPILAEKYVDGLLDPLRLPRTVLTEAKRVMGEYGYAGQFGQSPVPLGGGMFKISRIKIDEPPPIAKFRRIVRYWDKAATHKGGAYTVGVKMGEELRQTPDGRKLPHFWVLHVIRGQWDTDEREKQIHRTAKSDGKKVEIGVEDEGGSTGKDAALYTIRGLAGYRVMMDKPTGDKALRAEPFSAQVNGYNVSMAPGDWNHDYLEELRFFPASTYKDQVDASSGAFKRLFNPLIRIGATF